MKETIRTKVQELHNITEEEYLRAAINDGKSARQVARELGVSHVAVAKRIHRIAKPASKTWIPKKITVKQK